MQVYLQIAECSLSYAKIDYIFETTKRLVTYLVTYT